MSPPHRWDHVGLLATAAVAPPPLPGGLEGDEEMIEAGDRGLKVLVLRLEQMSGLFHGSSGKHDGKG